jgi:hypothetical protein
MVEVSSPRDTITQTYYVTFVHSILLVRETVYLGRLNAASTRLIVMPMSYAISSLVGSFFSSWRSSHCHSFTQELASTMCACKTASQRW